MCVCFIYYTYYQLENKLLHSIIISSCDETSFLAIRVAPISVMLAGMCIQVILRHHMLSVSETRKP